MQLRPARTSAASTVHVLHAIEGRLRIRVTAIKGDAAEAEALAVAIRRLAAVRSVMANPLTGSIVIRYAAAEVCESTLLDQLTTTLGCPVRPRQTSEAAGQLHELQKLVASAVVKSAMEAAVQRAILAMI